MTIAKYSIPIGTLKNWITAYNREGDDFFIDKRINSGGKSIDEADHLLSSYIKELRALHLPVTPKMIKDKALTPVNVPGFEASDEWLSNFMTRNRFAIKKKTHVIQQLKASYQKDVEVYFQTIDEILKNNEDPLFLNFDEVNVPFELSGDKTMDNRGSKEISGISHYKAKLSCTVALCAASDRYLLLPSMIFKSQSKTRQCQAKYSGWTTSQTCFTRFNKSGFNAQKFRKEYIQSFNCHLKRLYPNRKIDCF